MFLACQSSPHILNRASLLTQRSNEKHAQSIGSLIFRQPWQKQPLLCKIVENQLKRQIFSPTKSILLSYRFLRSGRVTGCYCESFVLRPESALSGFSLRHFKSSYLHMRRRSNAALLLPGKNRSCGNYSPEARFVLLK